MRAAGFVVSPTGPTAGLSLPLNIDEAVKQEGPHGGVPLLFICALFLLNLQVGQMVVAG